MQKGHVGYNVNFLTAMDVPETDSEDELPPGWEQRCTADGLVFYAEHSSQSTHWYHPRTGKKKKVVGEMPFGWERQITEEGKVFFCDHVNQKTTYTDPRLAFAVEETENIGDLRQRFDSSSTGLQVLHGRDLSGKVAIVTGANSGIGYETARTLAFHGCTVIFACRDISKSESAISKVTKLRPNAKCEAMEIDLSSLESVRTFSHTFALKYNCLHMLILNAGVFGLPYTITNDGLEAIFQINYLSHFYLAHLLQPVLETSAPSRIIFLSSESHRFATLDVTNITKDFLSPSLESYFTSILAYNNSKLCNILSVVEMQRRFGERGICCFAVHPGNVISTGLSRNWWLYRLLFAVVRPYSKSLQQACASVVYCAASQDIANCGGVYVNNCVPCKPSSVAFDNILANKLWNISLGIIEDRLGKRAFNILSL
ncbi:unnamed protein product, partial [Meganyctiphanes norvegica]